MQPPFGQPDIYRTLILSTLLLVAIAITTWVVLPLSAYLFPETVINAILLYIPHGVRVIAAWLYGWKSVAYLLPGNVINFMIMDGMAFGTVEAIIIFLVVACSPPLAFQTLAFFGFDMRADDKLRFNWRSVVFAGGLASLFNAASLHAVRFTSIPAEEHLVGIAFWVIGDTLGVIVVLVGLLVLDRWIRARTG
jgi:hypothetical protein